MALDQEPATNCAVRTGVHTETEPCPVHTNLNVEDPAATLNVRAPPNGM